jgi:hypothetical protein
LNDLSVVSVAFKAQFLFVQKEWGPSPMARLPKKQYWNYFSPIVLLPQILLLQNTGETPYFSRGIME